MIRVRVVLSVLLPMLALLGVSMLSAPDFNAQKAPPAKDKAEAEGPSELKIKRAEQALSKYTRDQRKVAEFMIWLRHSPETRASLPRWHHLGQLAAFDKDRTVDTPKAAMRLAALAKAGAPIDAAFRKNYKSFLGHLDNRPTLAWQEGYCFALAELVDAIYRRDDAKGLRSELVSVLKECQKERREADAPRTRLLVVLKRHELLTTKGELMAKNHAKSLIKAIDEIADWKERDFTSPVVWRAAYAFAADASAFALAFGDDRLRKYCVSALRTLNEERSENLAGISPLLTLAIEAQAAKATEAFAPELGEVMMSKVEASLIEASWWANGLDYPFVSSAAIDLESPPAYSRATLARGALMVAVALSGGYASTEKIEEFSGAKILEMPSQRKAVQTLMQAGIPRDSEAGWRYFQPIHREYYLWRIQESIEALKNNVLPEERKRGTGYSDADAGSLILALLSLGVTPGDKRLRALYEAFITRLLKDVDEFKRNRQTYAYSICLLAIQQYHQAKTKVKEQASKPNDPSRSRVKEIKAAKARIAKSLSEKEAQLVEDMACIILASHSEIGFGYSPHQVWSRDQNADLLGRYAKVASAMHADNSNSQFAMIGLKAAMVLGVKIPTTYFKHEAKRMIKELSTPEKTKVKVLKDYSDYAEPQGDTPDEKKASGPKAKSATKARTKPKARLEGIAPAGIGYSPIREDRAKSRAKNNPRQSASSHLSSGVISTLLIARERLAEAKELKKSFDKEIRHAVGRVKVYYAGHRKLKAEAIRGGMRDGYGLFGLMRASVMDGHRKIMHRDWRKEGREMWLEKADWEKGGFGNGNSLFVYDGLTTLSLNEFALPMQTLKEVVEEENGPVGPPPARSAGD